MNQLKQLLHLLCQLQQASNATTIDRTPLIPLQGRVIQLTLLQMQVHSCLMYPLKNYYLHIYSKGLSGGVIAAVVLAVVIAVALLVATLCGILCYKHKKLRVHNKGPQTEVSTPQQGEYHYPLICI